MVKGGKRQCSAIPNACQSNLRVELGNVVTLDVRDQVHDDLVPSPCKPSIDTVPHLLRHQHLGRARGRRRMLGLGRAQVPVGFPRGLAASGVAIATHGVPGDQAAL